jgi:hypothetical protein
MTEAGFLSDLERLELRAMLRRVRGEARRLLCVGLTFCCFSIRAGALGKLLMHCFWKLLRLWRCKSLTERTAFKAFMLPIFSQSLTQYYFHVFQALAIARVMRWIDAMSSHAVDDAIEPSQSLARRRHRFSQAKVRSTTHLLAITANS